MVCYCCLVTILHFFSQFIFHSSKIIISPFSSLKLTKLCTTLPLGYHLAFIFPQRNIKISRINFMSSTMKLTNLCKSLSPNYVFHFIKVDEKLLFLSKAQWSTWVSVLTSLTISSTTSATLPSLLHVFLPADHSHQQKTCPTSFLFFPEKNF